MPVAAPAQTMGIPRLQELRFLTAAGRAVAQGMTFDQVRRALIAQMESRTDIPGGNHAAYRLAVADPGRYVTNAATALKELMWLGFVERAQVPSRASAAAAYAAKRYSLTDEGRVWAEQLDRDPRGAYDELMQRLWVVHPQFAGFLRTLARGEFLVPTMGWTAVHAERVGPEGRPMYVRELAAKAARATASGRAGWTAREDEIRTAIDAYVERLDAAAARRKKTAFPNHRSFVQTCEEALVTFAFAQAGVPVDYISVEILRRWTQELLIANFSYHVPAGAATALRFWATADLEERDGRLVAVRRRPPSEWAQRMVEALPEAFERARALERGASYVAIYRVRAAACHQLAVNDVVFDTALRSLYERADDPEFPVRVNFELYHGGMPPTARPLRLTTRNGEREYQLMSLAPNRSRS